MIKDPAEKELSNKQEGGTSDAKHKMRSRQWSSLRNPRIVRVSRAFGGKDRHSKVSTIRGLRDRRVRLSVPTAIQLYDLQDKLNLNQPSKVVDWLLDAAQHEIDKLPPLPLMPASFIQFPQTWASSSAADVANDERINTTNNRVQSSSFNDNSVMSSSFSEDIASFPKFRGITKDMDAMPSYTSYHQWEPSNANASGVAENSSHDFHLASALSSRSLMPGPQFMMPTMPSSYVTIPNHFQIPSTFAQLLQWNSSGSHATMHSNINFRQYINHQEQHHEAQQEDMQHERER